MLWPTLCIIVAAASAARIIADHTPTPCAASYDEGSVEKWAQTVVRNYVNESSNGNPLHLLLLLGGSGSGKGTFMSRFHKNSDVRLLHHGLDEYLLLLPEYQTSIANSTHVFKDAADGCIPGAIQIAKAVGKWIESNRVSLAYEETGKDTARIFDRVLPQYASHRLTVVYIDNHPDVAIPRAKSRFLRTGRYADEDYIRGTYVNNEASFNALLPNASEAVYCDNSCTKYGTEPNCLTCFRAKDATYGHNLIPDAMLQGRRDKNDLLRL